MSGKYNMPKRSLGKFTKTTIQDNYTETRQTMVMSVSGHKLEAHGSQIMEIVRSTKDYRYSLLKNRNKGFRENFVLSLLHSMLFRRKSYGFQVIKQFYLFPDQTISEDASIDQYDRLFFCDQSIHSMVKIYETKEMESKMWALYNLKVLKLRANLQRFADAYQTVSSEIVRRNKADAFRTIRQFSLRIKHIQSVNGTQTPQQSSQDVYSLRHKSDLRSLKTPTTHIPHESVYQIRHEPSHSVRKMNLESERITISAKRIKCPEDLKISSHSSNFSRSMKYFRKGSLNHRIQNSHYTTESHIHNSPIRVTSPYIIKGPHSQLRSPHRRVCQSDRFCEGRLCSHGSSSKQYVRTVEGDCTINVYDNCVINKGTEKEQVMSSEEAYFPRSKKQVLSSEHAYYSRSKKKNGRNDCSRHSGYLFMTNLERKARNRNPNDGKLPESTPIFKDPKYILPYRLSNLRRHQRVAQRHQQGWWYQQPDRSNV